MADVYIGTDNVLLLSGLTDQVSDSYVNSATVTARLYDLTDRRHLDRAAAADNGDGTINITCTDHGLSEGDVILIQGADVYNGVYTLASGTADDTLVITTTYVARTFTGDEFLLKAIGDEITLSYVSESDGNYRGQLTSASTMKLEQDHTYWLIITAVDTSGYQTMFRVELTGAWAT